MNDFFPLDKLRVCLSAANEPVDVKGRRDFFGYRDLGLSAATEAMARATLISANGKGMERETGWHYHDCDVQANYVIRGWADLELEDGRAFRISVGDFLMMPGGLRHNEIATSDDLEVLEFSVPADMGTVPCGRPNTLPELPDDRKTVDV